MTYSSALFEQDELSLEAAQQKKYERLLSLLPDDAGRLLEIGCGWGGFAERAALEGREVTGVTISKAQQDYAQRRLDGKAEVRLQDYRDIDGKFDSVVSIEMIEAVGERYWPHYFRTIKQCLADGGRAALQVILIADESFSRYRKQSDFIRQYTFPGGMLIPPMKISECAEAAGLGIESFHRFGQDYARTLRTWLSRFKDAEKKIRALGHGEEFLRSWRYYFEFCAAGFSHGKHIDVAQISLSHR
jgi:cyclopropane-fatty-acyl-phospholipid synthase